MLSNKNALITGASRGIGRAIAKKFAENGAFVGINYFKSKNKAKILLDEIRKKGGDGMLLRGDVSSQEDCKRIVNDFVSEAGGIDILILNAGIYERGKFLDIDYNRWNRVMSTNLNSCYFMLKYSIPSFRDNGSIIFISSQLAFRGSAHGADYATSKAGMLGLMRSLSLELAPKIRVNAVAPGTIDTDIIADYTEDMRKGRESEIPLGRLGKPEDVANVCLFLASDLSSYITGEVINVNGGLYIH